MVSWIKEKLKESEKITIVGAGLTGQAVVEALAPTGIELFLTDENEVPEKAASDIRRAGGELESGGHSERALDADLMVVSPGVPTDSELIKTAMSRGISVVGEIELAYRISPTDRIVAVTGTNGKTTTVKLITKLLEYAGETAVACGNIGTPFISTVESLTPQDIAVVEVSSYQLETVSEFKPKVGVLTNLEPDHLKRHGCFESYREAKLNLFREQDEEDFAVINGNLALELPSPGPERSEFGPVDHPNLDLSLHQKENFGAAMKAVNCILPGRELDLPPDKTVKKGLHLPHRLQVVANVNGVTFVNDSKGTNPAATEAAIDSFPGPIRLLLGGKAKEAGYRSLVNSFSKSELTYFHLFGAASERLARRLEEQGLEKYQEYEKMTDAVRDAFAGARPGETVLLSPACASFDEFENYRKRGEVFAETIESLIAGRIDDLTT